MCITIAPPQITTNPNLEPYPLLQETSGVGSRATWLVRGGKGTIAHVVTSAHTDDAASLALGAATFQAYDTPDGTAVDSELPDDLTAHCPLPLNQHVKIVLPAKFNRLKVRAGTNAGLSVMCWIEEPLSPETGC
jgi:hypothetical protein